MIVPDDDPSIDNDDFVIRRVMSIHKRIKDGKSDFNYQAILLSLEVSGMSVSLKSSIIKTGLDPKRFNVNVSDCVGTIAFRVGEVRSLDSIIGLVQYPQIALMQFITDFKNLKNAWKNFCVKISC